MLIEIAAFKLDESNDDTNNQRWFRLKLPQWEEGFIIDEEERKNRKKMKKKKKEQWGGDMLGHLSLFDLPLD